MNNHPSHPSPHCDCARCYVRFHATRRVTSPPITSSSSQFEARGNPWLSPQEQSRDYPGSALIPPSSHTLSEPSRLRAVIASERIVRIRELREGKVDPIPPEEQKKNNRIALRKLGRELDKLGTYMPIRDTVVSTPGFEPDPEMDMFKEAGFAQPKRELPSSVIPRLGRQPSRRIIAVNLLRSKKR